MVCLRTDSVGCILSILDLWFQQRVEYKNEMKKYGKMETKKSISLPQGQLVQKILFNSLYGVVSLP